MQSKMTWKQSCRLFLTAVLLGTAAFVCAQSPEEILKQQPSQPGISIDTPAAEDVAKCKVGPFKEEGYAGRCLFGPDGTTPLRVICKRTNGPKESKSVEEIRYFKNGVEVFRDNLLNGQCRWMGDAGSRWGIGKRTGKTTQITSWKSITPEEATAEAVAALVANDAARYQLVALSEEDLKTLGVTGALADEMKKQIDSIKNFGDLAQKLSLPADAVWGAFNGNHPALLPKGKNGLTVDLPVYFNASVVVMKPSDPAAPEVPSQSQQIYIGDMVKVGDAWKIVGLPSGEPFGSDTGQVTAASIIFPTSGSGGVSALPESEGDYSEWADKLQQALAELDSTPADQMASKCEDIFNLYLEIAAKVPQEQKNFIRESANFLMTEIRLGNYPQGVEKLADLFNLLKDQDDRDLTAFIRLRQIVGNYYAVMFDKSVRDGDKMNAGDEYKENLVAFVDEYPQTPAAAEALMSLALDQEYVQEIDGALNYYSRAAKDFPQLPVGQKAAGAAARLGSVGKEFTLPADWKYTDGSPVGKLATGKTTVLFCWASWSFNPDDFTAMKKIAARPDVEVIGISLDQKEEEAASALQNVGKLPWKNVFVAGDGADAMESPTAIALGMQAAPVMILLDAQGKVLSPNIMSIQDLENRLESMDNNK